MLGRPHMAPLAEFVARLRSDGRVVPDLDPHDGGVAADTLFLMEKPGPQAGVFVSRDNAGPTPAAIRGFMAEAGIARERTALWNVIPWWDGRTAFAAADRHAGLALLPALLDLMPRLRGVALVGGTAGHAAPLLASRGLAVVHSAHPSPQVRAAFPERWQAIAAAWAQAAGRDGP